jgi:predicted metal-dependent phosphoesterase TrpH
MKYADLHIHTYFSDSTFSPEEVVKLAHKNNLSAISITDHDTVEAIDTAKKIAEEYSIEVIPGIELTAEVGGREVHILGYFFDYHNEDFLRKLKELQQVRVKRIYEMVERLKEQGIKKIDGDEVIALADKAAVGRVHLAMILKRHNLVSSISEAFRKYIGDNCPAYVSKFKLTPKEAIRIILDTKGIPVLAHPFTMDKDEYIPEWIKSGLMGIEVYYPDYSMKTISHYKALCQKHHLLSTGGSDDHGKAKEKILMGRIKVSYELVDRLKRAKEKIDAY